jgi:uncharacterized protein YjbI with pentapeptide repeats
VGPEKSPRERVEDLISLLVSDWRPTPRQVLWAIRIAIALGLLLAISYAYGITLWDWLKLLIVPAVIAIGGLWFNRQQQERQREDERRQQERGLEIENQRAQDGALQAYLDQISQLLLDKDRPLSRARSGDRLSLVTRALTLTVLGKLSGGRKGQVLQFLYESELIHKDTYVVDLRGADFSDTALNDATLYGRSEQSYLSTSSALAILTKIHLPGANLNRAKLFNIVLWDADLSGAHLNEANLEHAWLNRADLMSANLNEANLRWANLQNANLYGAHLNHADMLSIKANSAVLYEAHLNEAELRQADLSKADLHGAQLNGANLSGANLSGANVTTDQLARCETLAGATMPNGQKYEDWLKSKGSGEDGEKE